MPCLAVALRGLRAINFTLPLWQLLVGCSLGNTLSLWLAFRTILAGSLLVKNIRQLALKIIYLVDDDLKILHLPLPLLLIESVDYSVLFFKTRVKVAILLDVVIEYVLLSFYSLPVIRDLVELLVQLVRHENELHDDLLSAIEQH